MAIHLAFVAIILFQLRKWEFVLQNQYFCILKSSKRLFMIVVQV